MSKSLSCEFMVNKTKIYIHIYTLAHAISFIRICIRWEFPTVSFELNPLTTNIPHHVETSQLICNPNQLTGFYMIGNIRR